jgi:hypothetical protein
MLVTLSDWSHIDNYVVIKSMVVNQKSLYVTQLKLIHNCKQFSVSVAVKNQFIDILTQTKEEISNEFF